MHRQQIADSCRAAQHVQQTGKAEALPELTEVPEVRTGLHKTAII